MKPYRVILNPASGHGNGERSLPKLHAALSRAGLPVEILSTERPGHAVELAKKAVDDQVDVLIAAGGDGTLNEIINGMMERRAAGAELPPVGILCVGRGNDFAGSLGLPVDFDAACQVIKTGRLRKIDIGRVYGGLYPQGRYFVNCVGVGFDAVGTIEAAKLPRWGGFASFLVAILKTIFLYNHAPLATICYGEKAITQRSLMISIMNGRRLGGGFLMAPNSQSDDGLFDLCIAEQMPPMDIIQLVPHFMKGTQASKPTIKTGQASTILIQSKDGPLPTQTDGEIISTDGWQIRVEMIPRQINIIC